jgi:methyltransferase (TIGR00027 family)
MVLVAMEQSFPEAERILTDDLALPILPLVFRVEVRLFGPFTGWVIRKSEQKVPGLWGGIMSRKRFIDDRVTEGTGDGIEAVVNLGAGFDTRAYRLLTGVATWEVDLEETIRAKSASLERLLGSVPAHTHLAPIDFDRQDLKAVLASHGCALDRRTFFIWEGVTQYLTEAGVRATFDVLAGAPAGSRLAFTYTPKDFIDGRAMYGQEYLYRRMLVKDRLWSFGLDPDGVGGFVDRYGWRVVEHLGYDDLDARYVRPTGRILQSMAIERMVLAEKV